MKKGIISIILGIEIAAFGLTYIFNWFDEPFFGELIKTHLIMWGTVGVFLLILYGIWSLLDD